MDAVLDIAMPRENDGKLHLVHVVARAHADGRVHVERAIRHGSHLLSSLLDANAIALIDCDVSPVAGDVVALIVIDAERLGHT